MQTVRTSSMLIERDEAIREKPAFAVSDYMRIDFGQYEGHRFWIKDVRYNHDRRCFEYLYGGFGGIMGGWMAENQIVLLERKEPTHDAR